MHSSSKTLQQQQRVKQLMHQQQLQQFARSTSGNGNLAAVKLPAMLSNTAPIAAKIGANVAAAPAAPAAAAAADNRPILTYEIGTGDDNSVFSGLAEFLVSHSGSSEARWIRSHVKIDTAMARTERATPPCCIQLSGINLYLGVKIVTENLVAEANAVVARAKRNGGALAVCRHMKKKDELPDSVYTSFPARIVVAFYPLTKGITLKANMCQVLVQHYGAPRVFSDITPETYILTPRREVNATGLSDQRALWLRAMASERHSKTIWIAKISHGAKGRGIVLIRPPGDERAAAATAGAAAASSSIARTASQFLADLDRSSDANPWVVQLYVDNPMLLSGRKFDLRAWVLLTPRLDIMLYREGVARMCSVPYSNDDFSVFGHISNHCLQVQSADFGKGLSKTNELAWTELDQLLLRHKKRGVAGMGVFAEPGAAVGGSMSMDEDVLPQMKRIVHDTFACIKSKVLETYTAGAIDAFQLFGFDFVLDATGKLWLCEVNGAAGMAQHLLHPMIEDLADTVIWDMLPAARPKDFQRKNGRPNWFTKWFSRDQW